MVKYEPFTRRITVKNETEIIEVWYDEQLLFLRGLKVFDNNYLRICLLGELESLEKIYGSYE